MHWEFVYNRDSFIFFSNLGTECFCGFFSIQISVCQKFSCSTSSIIDSLDIITSILYSRGCICSGIVTLEFVRSMFLCLRVDWSMLYSLFLILGESAINFLIISLTYSRIMLCRSVLEIVDGNLLCSYVLYSVHHVSQRKYIQYKHFRL